VYVLVADVSAVEVAFRSLDGLLLRGTLLAPPGVSPPAVVMVHGGGVTRDEGGLFARIAEGLAAAGVASLRFDFRAHGTSEGRQEELTLAGVVNDVRAAADKVQQATGAGAVGVVGASFGGGLAALFAARYPDRVRSLVLINPLLNYKKRFIDDKPYWSGDRVDAEVGRELAERGFVAHSPSFKLGRALLNEVFYLRPEEEIATVAAPTLFLHGTRDTFIPVESSREYVQRVRGEARLIEFDGAQHGLAVHDDPQYLDPQTQAWQAQAVGDIVDWVVTHR
jgi:pimeloyl-ACP methyl ester carboxylesterase